MHAHINMLIINYIKIDIMQSGKNIAMQEIITTVLASIQRSL